MKIRGFTLIELLVIMSIIAILLSIATLAFNRMQMRYAATGQAREVFADISDQRIMAMHTKRLYRVTFTSSKKFSCESFAPEDEALAAGTVVVTKEYKYPLVRSDGTTFLTGTQISFDSRGLADNELIIRILSPSAEAPLDCIDIKTTQTTIGKMEGGVCNAR